MSGPLSFDTEPGFTGIAGFSMYVFVRSLRIANVLRSELSRSPTLCIGRREAASRRHPPKAGRCGCLAHAMRCRIRPHPARFLRMEVL
jgi:hypothetical protein